MHNWYIGLVESNQNHHKKIKIKICSHVYATNVNAIPVNRLYLSSCTILCSRAFLSSRDFLVEKNYKWNLFRLHLKIYFEVTAQNATDQKTVSSNLIHFPINFTFYRWKKKKNTHIFLFSAAAIKCHLKGILNFSNFKKKSTTINKHKKKMQKLLLKTYCINPV